MRQVRTQKRKRVVTLVGAVITASALLSAGQPALATSIPIVDSGRAFGYVVKQGDFEIRATVFEDLGSGALCASIRHIRGEEHYACIDGADVDVSDILDSAWGRGTIGWSTSVQPKGRSKPPTYKYGTLTVDVTWTGTGETTTDPNPFNDNGSFYQWRAATWSGTITDSEWGTFVVNGASGELSQSQPTLYLPCLDCGWWG